MTVPPAAYPVLQMSAVARVENLRRHDISEINAALTEYADTSYSRNVGLTGRERICRLANHLASIKDLAWPVQNELNSIVTQLRRAFDLSDIMEQTTTYGRIVQLVEKLGQKYPVYCIGDKLRTYNRFVGVRDVADIKTDTARMVSELLVIGMNADGEGFRADLEETICDMTKVMLTWM